MATQQTFSFFEPSVATAVPLKKRRSRPSRATSLVRTSPSIGSAVDSANAGLANPNLSASPSPCETRAEPGSSGDDRSGSELPNSELPNNKLSSGPPSVVPAGLTREAILNQLRSRVGCITEAPEESVPTFSTGVGSVDAMLPQRGLKLDTLTEWVAETTTSGAATLAMAATASLLHSHSMLSGPLVVVDPEGTFYPPAAFSLGIPAERIVWVRPPRHADTVWAIDQALRCQAVAAVWAHVGDRLDDRDARRLQLAAEIGSTPGLLVRPSSVRGKPSFADVRFHVSQKGVRPLIEAKRPDPFVRVWRVTLERCRGASVGAGAWVTMDENAKLRSLAASEVATWLDPMHRTKTEHSHDHEKTAAMRLASRLADPTVASGNQHARRRA